MIWKKFFEQSEYFAFVSIILKLEVFNFILIEWRRTGLRYAVPVRLIWFAYLASSYRYDEFFWLEWLIVLYILK